MTGRTTSSLRLYCYGLCMGTADALPGVSGGTVALLLGIYSRLIAAVSELTPTRVVEMLREAYPPSVENFQNQIAENDLYFLAVLGAGMLTAVVVIANLVTVLYETYPTPLFAFFTGLIGASALILYRGLQLRTPSRLIAVASGFLLAFLVSSGVIGIPASGYPAVFLAGAIAISAMILPGISGSLILILLGKYVYLSSELSLFVASLTRLVNGGSTTNLIGPGTTILVFVIGGFIGLLTISRVIRAALEARRGWTLTFLVSLIAGSIRAPIEEISDHTTPAVETYLVVTFWVLSGAVALLVIDRAAGGLQAR